MLLLVWFVLEVLVPNPAAVEKIGCLPTEFRCGSGQCVDGGRYCDGNPDCYDGSDEPDRCTSTLKDHKKVPTTVCLTQEAYRISSSLLEDTCIQDCNRTYYGLSDVKYPLRLSERRSPTCTLTFVAAGGRYGERIEITFLSFQIGIFELDRSTCLRGYMEVEENNPIAKKRRSRSRPKKKSSPRVKGPPLRAPSGSFCGPLIGESATFYSMGDSVKLTVFVPPQGAAGQPVVPRLYLTYRFLRKDSAEQSSHIGRGVVAASKCDSVLTNCHFRHCIIRSPNFPGFYLRNISCRYWIRQDSAPPGKVAQIEVHQENEFKINVPRGHTNNDRYKPGTLTSECAGDAIKIFDGRTSESPLLAEFCGAGPLPVIRSSGPNMLIQLVSVPSQPLTNSHFELAVRIHFARNKGLRVASEGCSVTVDGGRHPVGILRLPDHSVPSGTICTYRVIGRKPTDRVWLYFASYHVPDLHPWSDDEHCDVGKLEIQHSVPKIRHHHHQHNYHHYHRTTAASLSEKHPSASSLLVETYCEKRSPRQCGHASDFPDLVPSRPCSVPEESYLSPGPEIVLKMSFLSSTAIKNNGAPHFAARYEVVETSSFMQDISSELCLSVIDSREHSSGTLESPRNIFLYGRGGSKQLLCKYELRGTKQQRVRITVNEIYFPSTVLCNTVFDSVTQRHECKIIQLSKFAAINITEIWQDMKLFVGCACDSSASFILETVGHQADVEFLVRNMGPKDDFRTFRFTLSYEFVPASTVCENAHPSGSHVMSGSRGHLGFSLHAKLPLQCRWLLAAFPSRALYITIKGRKFDAECKNKILFYSVYNKEPYAVFCSSNDEIYESFFSASWHPENQHPFQPDLTLMEFLMGEPGQLEMKWIEVTRPGTNPCKLECPELEACIGEDLACDGIHHCPVTANDEDPERCTQFPLTTLALCTATVVALLAMTGLGLLIRYKLTKSSDKSVIPPPDMYRNDYKRKPANKSPVR